MFVLHSSNKTENLAAHLASVMEHAPLSSALRKEVFLIQSQGMERWLSQQLAQHFGVWANFDFLFPGRFFNFIAQQLDSRLDAEAFERSRLPWRFEALLRNLDDPDLTPLRHYLSGSSQRLKRFQLAQQLAQVFDQYQIMRPDLLAGWERGKLFYDNPAERWQKVLWQRLITQIGQNHRGALWLEVISKLSSAQAGFFADKLPERISVFGINAMPPLFLLYLQSLAKHCQIHLFLLNPAQTYWADLAKKRKTIIDSHSTGHPLLISLGQQGREFQEMILDTIQFDLEPESFEPVANANNLQQLQNDILQNAISGRALTFDGSIGIHACHSRKREVEVLKDQLLLLLEANSKLELRDIAVMAPDIQLYEPFISAVFHDIQHSIADRSIRLENKFLDAFIRFLELSQSRFGWQQVLDLLEREEVYPNFGLSEADLDLIKFWVQETNVRWGRSAQHKQELGLPPLAENTWQAALDRLFMGYAVGHDDGFVLGILPYLHIEGSSASALGGLHDFLQLLFQANSDFKQPKPIKAWSTRFSYYAGHLFSQSGQSENRQLYTLLAELASDGLDFHQEPVELAVIIEWLDGMMAEQKSAKGFLRGQLTFCSMLPMRSIPFKVIALMGMNEGEFPKTDRKHTFDLIAQNFRKGDRSRRADDRYQFLEILLSARQQLIITYIGQSQNAKSSIPPSEAVSELLDVLRENYKLDNLVTLHPLQAFNRCYFDGTSPLFSFSEPHCETAKALANPKADPQIWWKNDDKTETDAGNVIELNDLFSFYQHPQRYFFRRQLNLHLSGIYAETEEREPFSVNDLNTYTLDQEWIAQALKDKPQSLAKLKAQGKWLPGALGELEFAGHDKTIQDFVESIKQIDIGAAVDDLVVNLTIDDVRVVGKLANRYRNGNLHYRFADLKGKDFITAWLHHLISNRLEQKFTFLISADESLRFTDKTCHQDYLPTFLQLYRLGQQHPDVFFTEAALAYLKQADKLKTSKIAVKSPLAAARDALKQALNQAYEHELRQLYGNLAEPGEAIPDSFASLCETLLVSAWERAHED